MRNSSKLSLLISFTGVAVVWTIAVWLIISLATYTPSDPGLSWSSTESTGMVANLGGRVGAHAADIGLSAFGFSALLIPIIVILAGWNWLLSIVKSETVRTLAFLVSFLGAVLTLFSASGLEHLHASYSTQNIHGGIAGYEFARLGVALVGTHYATLLFVAFFALGSASCRMIPWLAIFDVTGKSAAALGGLIVGGVGNVSIKSKKTKSRMKSELAKSAQSESLEQSGRQAGEPAKKRSKVSLGKKTKAAPAPRKEPVIIPIDTDPPPSKKSVSKKPQVSPADVETVEDQDAYDASLVPPQHGFPDTSMLDPSEADASAYSSDEILHMGDRIGTMLAEFNVDVTVREAHPGPVITQFEIEPAAGVKANQVISLTNDLARTLTVPSVRVVDNIPGTSYVGLEVPNKHRETVRLVDGLESDAYKQSAHPLTLVLGKDIRGNTVISNLASMPHLLIAGTTGSGKSVCLNAILLSFLFKSDPEQLRLIMVDPKMLEFSVYEGIPNLLTPVITDMNKTHNALNWCISEMERRFALMAGLGVRSMENYNEYIANAKHPVLDPTALESDSAKPLKPFPYIVFVIDELSDLIMVMGKKAEELIIRIAQRARAAGIHLIVATQRPSTDVIRGVLKANIPTRIAFKVASNADSRTILDQTGAEHLLGRGDMLFIPPGSSAAVRVHGAFVSDDEVKRVVDHLKSSSQPTYDEEVTKAVSGEVGADDFGSGSHDEIDAMYEQAVEFVSRSKTTSISKLQRELRIGYNRAARIIEAMEAEGIVSPPQSGGVRAVQIAASDD